MPYTDLFFSEYIEGSSNNKALEIYNGTDAAIDLSALGYVVQMYFNGGTSPSTFALTGIVDSGDVYVFAQSSASAAILAQADQTSGAGFFNGDDAIVLRKGGATGTIVDAIGQIGVDPGSEWGSGLISTADNTLRRKISVTSGDTNGSDPFDPSVEWEGFATDAFDDLGTYNPGGGGAGVTLTQSGGGTTVNEQGETTDTYTIALNTVPTGAVDLTIAADDDTQISSDGVNFFDSIDLTLTDTTAQTITVRAVNDLDVEGNHTSVITHSIASSADPEYANLSIPDLNVNVLDNDVSLSFTKISEIQGTGATSTLVGNTVTIEAIVVGDFQQTGSAQNLQGFYLQEEDADADLNALTSEGLFVFDSSFGVDVAVGDRVQITGVVTEFSGSGSSLTELANLTSVSVVDSGNALPTAATVSFPLTNVADLEAVEGMRVTVPDTLTVTEHFQLGRFGQVVLSANGATNQAGTDGRLEQYTQFNAPSAAGYAAYLAEIDKRRLILDDGQSIQNPDPIVFGRDGNPLSAANTLRGGDTVVGLSGILDDRFGDYRIQATAPVDFTAANPRPNTTPDVGGTLKVASFNVLNYFNGDGTGGGFPTSRGAESATEFQRQRDKTIATILGMDADVVGLIEIENDGYGANSAIQDLVNGLNAIAGAGTYDFIDPGMPNLGTDAIAVGFIYKPNAVTPVGTAATIANGFGQGAFDNDNRKPLAQTFEENGTGEQFTAVINHFKSKGSSAGNPGDADAGDGQGLSNGTRTRAAQDLAAWLATNPTGTADADYLILGDLNAYAQEDPIVALENAGYENLLPDTTYSYVFDGQWGALDHALANGSLEDQITSAAKWHINADEPGVLDYNTNFKSAAQVANLYSPNAFRSSDHDPVLVGLDLTSGNGGSVIDGTSAPDTLTGTSGDDIITGFLKRDLITTGAGDDQIVYTQVGDRTDVIKDFEAGADQIVLTAMLDKIRYGGSDPIADGHISFAASGSRSIILVDRDGSAGSAAPLKLAFVENVSVATLSNPDNFVF